MPPVPMALDMGSPRLNKTRLSSRSRSFEPRKQDGEPSVRSEEFMVLGQVPFAAKETNDDDDDKKTISTDCVESFASCRSCSVRPASPASKKNDESTGSGSMESLLSGFTGLKDDATHEFFKEGFALADRAARDGNVAKAAAMRNLLIELARVDPSRVKNEATETDESLISDLSMTTRVIPFKVKKGRRGLKGLFKKNKIPSSIVVKVQATSVQERSDSIVQKVADIPKAQETIADFAIRDERREVEDDDASCVEVWVEDDRSTISVAATETATPQPQQRLPPKYISTDGPFDCQEVRAARPRLVEPRLVEADGLRDREEERVADVSPASDLWGWFEMCIADASSENSIRGQSE